jgi:hypothetical protein
MSDQVTNKAVAEENQLRVVEMVLPPSPLASEYTASQNRDSALHTGGGFADGVRLLRELHLYHSCPGGISRDPV